VENRGLGFPFADSSPKTPINSLKSCFVSIFAGGFGTSTQERWGVLGVNVGARMFRGTSWAGGKSEGGTASAGNDVDSSLAGAHVESRAHAMAKFLPRGRLNLLAAHGLLGRGLGCVDNG